MCDDICVSFETFSPEIEYLKFLKRKPVVQTAKLYEQLHTREGIKCPYNFKGYGVETDQNTMYRTCNSEPQIFVCLLFIESTVKPLLDSLLWDIYGRQRQSSSRLRGEKYFCQSLANFVTASDAVGQQRYASELELLSILKLIDICAILKVEMRLMASFLEHVLIERDRLHRQQDYLCAFVDLILRTQCDDAHRKMRFSLSPPPPKAIFSSNVATITYQNGIYSNFLSSIDKEDNNTNNMSSHNIEEEQQQEDCVNDAQQTNDEAVSDYIQWLHAMKLVARLPGGIPPEFRRKLWLSLAEKYMKSKSIDWAKEEEKCFCEKWREDDEELGVQIVKDLHRTGSTLCTGPAGDTNQAKLKRILLGYARYNPEVGYCQGFNMLGALILQVMDKKESESIKVMVYLVEGILPPGYFCGSMGGLQADMAVFRELMQTKLPRLAKHLQKLQGPIENAYEPPLTNVFTMQWFLTMFCTCLPMSCVLRVWDLVLIEGSDILLRTALVLWSLLEERVLSTRSADDFYGKMGSFSSELLNGHLIDSNGLIEKVVQLGPIADIQKLRDKHLYNITPLIHKPGIHLYYDEEEPDTDEDSRLAVATVWGLPWGRRGSQGQSGGAVTVPKQVLESKDRLALDISLLKKQYDRLRERQKQAHIILTTACSTARQSTTSSTATAPVNQLLLGRPAIVTNKGRRPGPPTGAIPPARKPSLPAVLQTKQQPSSSERELKRGETVHWHNTDDNKRRRDSLTWKEIKAERAAMLSSGSVDGLHSRKIRARHLGKSDSSSYSEESDNDAGSSTDTSLCDEKEQSTNKNRTNSSSKEGAENINSRNARKTKNSSSKLQEHYSVNDEESADRKRPKSWAPSSSEIPFVLMGSDSPMHSGDEKNDDTVNKILYEDFFKKEDSATESDCFRLKSDTEPNWPDIKYSPIAGDLASPNLKPLHSHAGNLDCISKTPNTVQLSHTHNISRSLAVSKIGTSSTFVDSTESLGSGDGNEIRKFDVSDEGVTNQYFERVNNVERPNKLDLPYSLNEDEYVDSYKETETKTSTSVQGPINLHDLSADQPKTLEEPAQKLEFLHDYSEKSPEVLIKEATMELMVQIQKTLSTSQMDDGPLPILPGKIKEVRDYNSTDKSKRHSVSSISAKRRDPRRMTLTRSSTINTEESYKPFPKRLSMQLSYDFNSGTSYNVSQTCLSTETSNLISEGETKRRIPSTEVLEERFHRMERELLLDKTDQNQLSSLPTQRLPEKREVFKTENENTSSSLLEKQYTLSDSISKKDIDLRKNNSDNSEEEEVNNSRDEKRDKNDLLKNNKDADSISETESKSEKAEKQRSNIRAKLNRIPSTAELEDRFNALERDKSKQKYHPSKTKKEPPDDLEDKTNNKQTSSFKNGEAVPDGNGKDATIGKAKEELKNRETVMKKKSPPSTKELEKRFEALERRLSVATSEAEANENLKKSNSPVKSEKKVNSGLGKTEQCANSSSHVSKTEDGENILAEKREHSEQIRNKTEKEPIAEDVKKQPSKRRSSHEESEKKKIEKQQTAKDDSCESKEDFNETQEYAEEVNDKPVTEDSLQLNQGSEILAKGVVDHDAGDDAGNNNSANKIKCGKGEQSPDQRKKSVAESKNNEATNENAPENSQKIAKTNATNKRQYEEKDKSKIREAFHEKCNQLSDELSQNLKTDEPKQIISSEEKIQKSDSYQRRRSEPPSTAELEKRYEALKRRMSSRPIDEKPISKSKIKKNETLTSSSNKSTPSENKAATENLQVNVHKLQSDEESKVEASSESTLAVAQSPSRDEEEEINALIEGNAVPNAPPMPPGVYLDKNRIINKKDQTQQRALIEELQEKIKVQANGENIKPSAINPNRKSPAQRSPYHADETSEAHATSAFYRSENYEPWSPVNQRMVRRFSDLPSRADLENRLQFLEQQLSNKLRKKRRASDSEVASKSKRPEEGPATSKGQRSAGDLEMRVQALEKQLSENSLKLLETMNAKMKEAITSSDNAPCTPTKLSTETIDVTGKELVKYTHIGEVTQTESHKPINISINIKMTLNKNEKESSPEQEAQQQHHQDVHEIPSTEELERRLQILEQQIKDSKAKNSITTQIKDDLQANEKPKQNFEVLEQKETEDISRKESEPNEIAAENNEIKDNDKNAFNESDDVTEQTDPEPECAIDESEETKVVNKDCSIDENHEKNQQTSQEAAAETVSPAQVRIEKTGNELLELPPNVIDATNIEEMDPNKKTLVLLLDNQPKAMKVRRLTRANTEELEGLFQALEKQLSERNLIKSEDGKLKHADDATVQISLVKKTAESEAISQLSKEIAKEFTKEEKLAPKEIPKEEPFDWGRDPSKHHLKRKTVYLPSTKELEARFRSLERQIKLLEDVEKIDVEQRLNEIERKIKLQYSLSHEKDINKFLDLCEGKGVNGDDNEDTSCSDTKSLQRRSPYTSPVRKSTADKKSQTPTRPINTDDRIPSTDDLEFRFRSLELEKKKSKANIKSKNKEAYKKQAIHPLEMLLDPSPDESSIPTTGELEHRMRLLEEGKSSPSPPSRKSRSRSPKTCNIERQLSNSPIERELPSTEELEARLEALEQEHTFDFKMQKNFKEFNQKLKDAVSPSISFEEFKASKSREESPKHVQSVKESRASNIDEDTRISPYRSTSPKVIRFKEDEESHLTSRSKFERTVSKPIDVLQLIKENFKSLERILKKTLADTTAGNSLPPTASSSEGLNAKGTRLIKETSPLRRSGTHTGVPLRTGENINDRLNSIKNTIKCIDTLCEEKPYRKEKCQRYIDSLFSDSTYFSGKKASLEDLAGSTRNSSRSASKDRGPSIRIIEHSEAFTRSTGSIESVRSSSPLGLSYSPQYRSNRDLRRDFSPRRRREEEREEYESRVRRDNILPIYFSDVHSTLSHKSHSLTKFHKVDRHLNTNNTDVDPDERLRSRSASISPLRSPYRSKEMPAMMTHNTTTSQSTNTSLYTKNCTSSNKFFGMDNMTTSPYRYSPHNLTTYESLYTRNSNTPIYSPAKLEIRHTTVTSTFYDRVLTEKQIEKTLSRPSSRSPIVSPSVPYKNYADIMPSDVKSSPLHTNVNVKKDGLLLLTTDYTPINNYQFDKPLTVTNAYGTSPSRIRTLNKKDSEFIDPISVKSHKTALDSDMRTITATASTYLSSDKNISQHSAFDRVSFTNNNKLPASCPTTTNAIINVLTTLQHPPRQNDIFGLPSIAQVQLRKQ
uniref:TBC1 domain family member 30 n=1 Tax=Glossina austeni TaxID=7395 RepID=A0A1A9V933_GLOAU